MPKSRSRSHHSHHLHQTSHTNISKTQPSISKLYEKVDQKYVANSTLSPTNSGTYSSSQNMNYYLMGKYSRGSAPPVSTDDPIKLAHMSCAKLYPLYLQCNSKLTLWKNCHEILESTHKKCFKAFYDDM